MGYMDEFASGNPCLFENSEPNSWPFILNDWYWKPYDGEPQQISKFLYRNKEKYPQKWFHLSLLEEKMMDTGNIQ